MLLTTMFLLAKWSLVYGNSFIARSTANGEKNRINNKNINFYFIVQRDLSHKRPRAYKFYWKIIFYLHFVDRFHLVAHYWKIRRRMCFLFFYFMRFSSQIILSARSFAALSSNGAVFLIFRPIYDRYVNMHIQNALIGEHANLNIAKNYLVSQSDLWLVGIENEHTNMPYPRSDAALCFP